MSRLVLLFGLFFVAFSLNAQDVDPVLFTVEGTPIHVSEFKYIYTKTNRENADFSRASLEEYLELYTKFKLKVQLAKEMQLDTIKQLQEELEGYRRQLADSYLINKEVTQKLVKEVYERGKEDIDFSHILVKVEENAAPEDTLRLFNVAKSIKEKIDKGADFKQMVTDYSADNTTKENGGKVGYVNVLFPNGLYDVESAVYNLSEGEVGGPVRSPLGYHILKVNDRRPARGEMEVAHILIRKKKNSNEDTKAKIDDVYKLLQEGKTFETLVTQFSEDKKTNINKGYIGFFGINQYQKTFEEAAFGLAEDGAISKPVETKAGWHIIKRISKRAVQPFDVEKRRLEEAVKKDGRFEQAKLAVLIEIKKSGNLRENKALVEKISASLDETFLTYRWKPENTNDNTPIIELGSSFKVSVGDFMDYLKRATAKRMNLARSGKKDYVFNSLYDEFLTEMCFKYEESQLEIKYPDFKALMREYQEGILLFEATKMLVWDKASQDSAGLEKYHETIKARYRWRERAVVSEYQLEKDQQNLLESIRSFARKAPYGKVLNKYNVGGKEILTVKELKLEKPQNDGKIDDMDWQIGAISSAVESPDGKYFTFKKIEKLIDGENKTLNEARGYIIADYQGFLESEWVKELSEKYKVKVNKKVLESLIK